MTTAQRRRRTIDRPLIAADCPIELTIEWFGEADPDVTAIIDLPAGATLADLLTAVLDAAGYDETDHWAKVIRSRTGNMPRAARFPAWRGFRTHLDDVEFLLPLDGWEDTTEEGPDCRQYLVGDVVRDGETIVLAFDLGSTTHWRIVCRRSPRVVTSATQHQPFAVRFLQYPEPVDEG